MKSFFLTGVVFFTTLTIFAQSSTTVSLGVNVIDNNGRKIGGIVPFIAGDLEFKAPVYFTVEQRFKSNFSTSLSLTTNQLESKTNKPVLIDADVTGQFYFNDYILKSNHFESYVGVGLGRFSFENKGFNKFKYLGGVSYWFSRQYGISSQLIGNIGLPPVNTAVRNFYQINMGIIWRDIKCKQCKQKPSKQQKQKSDKKDK